MWHWRRYGPRGLNERRAENAATITWPFLLWLDCPRPWRFPCEISWEELNSRVWVTAARRLILKASVDCVGTVDRKPGNGVSGAGQADGEKFPVATPALHHQRWIGWLTRNIRATRSPVSVSPCTYTVHCLSLIGFLILTGFEKELNLGSAWRSQTSQETSEARQVRQLKFVES